MNFSTQAGLLATVISLTACSTLPNRIVNLGNHGDCSAISEDKLLNDSTFIGPATSTEDLQCAMTIARKATTPAFVKSSRSTEIALHLAERLQPGTDREALAAEGVSLAERALKSGAKDDAAVHYYLAANLGLAINDHPVQAAENIHRLEDELSAAARLSKSVDHGGPLRLLGMLYLKAPPWPTGIGDGDKALAYLKDAVTQHPDHPLNHLFYAEALFEVDEKTPEAQAEIEKGKALLEQGPWGFNRVIWQKEFADVIQEISKAPR